MLALLCEMQVCKVDAILIVRHSPRIGPFRTTVLQTLMVEGDRQRSRVVSGYRLYEKRNMSISSIKVKESRACFECSKDEKGRVCACD